MAKTISAVTVAIATVKQGASARQGLKAARENGIQIRDATWFRLVSEVRVSLNVSIYEASLPLNRRPIANEISVMTTKQAKGWLQYADVFVRDKETGVVSIRPYAVRGTTLQTRGAIIRKAIDAMTTASSPFGSFPDDQVLGAAYTATYQMTPGL